MGPFIFKQPTRESEIQRIIALLKRGIDGPPTHQGSWVRVRSREYSHIQCHTCGWGSEGPLLNTGADDYEGIRDGHRDQWILHRAERAVDEGVDI